jgi:general secretion pathway protein A
VYEAFFSLEDAPFVLTPDPRFLLRSKRHHEVLSTLLYGITSQKGLMALIGDVGTGKTILCRALLRELPRDVKSALVLNPYLSDVELLGAILDDLGVERRGSTKGELMTVLGQYLLAAGAEGKTVVVVLDEAQQMSIEALEQIRLLSTFETTTRKLLQIVLVGQPELEEKIGRRELRQLDQRIGIRCYLEPLSKKETFRYIEHRLRVAGLAGSLPFSRGALLSIYHHSRGIPRVINLLCDRAMTAAFSAHAREVTPALVRAAIRNLDGGRRRRHQLAPGAGARLGVWRKAIPVGLGVAGVLLMGAAAAGVHRNGWAPTVLQLLPHAAAPAALPAPRVTTQPRASVADSTAPSPAIASPVSPRDEPAPGAARAATTQEGVKGLVAQVLRLWGVNDDLSEQTVGAWPRHAEGMPNIPAIAARYQLSATWLPGATLTELRAVDLPAIVELSDGAARPYLLRRLDGSTATLVSPGGEETRIAVDNLEASWTRSAWIIWRNVDLLPADPNQALSPVVIATLGLRLQKLGLLKPPIPTSNNERFQQAVRRFQTSMGLPPDGVVGPRTTLALSRVVAGRFGPTLAVTASSR